jgi:hypothetical protein
VAQIGALVTGIQIELLKLAEPTLEHKYIPNNPSASPGKTTPGIAIN